MSRRPPRSTLFPLHDALPICVLWLNALRMTIVPLVFSLLVTGVASAADAAATGRLAARAFMIFAAVLLVAALYGAGAISGLLALWPVDPASGFPLSCPVHGVALPSSSTCFRARPPFLHLPFLVYQSDLTSFSLFRFHYHFLFVHLTFIPYIS